MGRRFIPLTVLALILCLAGSFTIVGDWSIGKKGFAIVNVSGGTIDIGDDLNIGPKAGEITFNMTGGVVDVNDSLIVARKGGAVAHCTLTTLGCIRFESRKPIKLAFPLLPRRGATAGNCQRYRTYQQ